MKNTKKKILLTCFLPFVFACGENELVINSGEIVEKGKDSSNIKNLANEEFLAVVADKCIACGKCIAIDREHFTWASNRRAMAISQENLNSRSLLQAINHCPTRAITFE